MEHHSEDMLTTPEYAYSNKTTVNHRSTLPWKTICGLWVHAPGMKMPEVVWSTAFSLSISGSELLHVHSLYAASVSFSDASANSWTRQSQSLDENLLPVLPIGILNRKIDYCLTPSFDNSQFSPVYEFLSSRPRVKIGLMNDAMMENLLGVEKKKKKN